MKVIINGLKYVSAAAVTSFLENHELGDIIAYGFAHLMPVSNLKYHEELDALENIVRAMLVSNSKYGVYSVGVISLMADSDAFEIMREQPYADCGPAFSITIED
jgi:hypothetical protein